MTAHVEIAWTIPARRLARVACFEDAMALARVACDSQPVLVESVASMLYARALALRDQSRGGQA